MTDGLSGKATIVGIGATDFSKNSGRSELRLAAEAVLDALDDAGLTPRAPALLTCGSVTWADGNSVTRR
jgi:hypothetical protein